MIQITKATEQMTADQKAEMAALKAEYTKLSTSAKRMKEIYARMVQVREGK